MRVLPALPPHLADGLNRVQVVFTPVIVTVGLRHPGDVPFPSLDYVVLAQEVVVIEPKDTGDNVVAGRLGLMASVVVVDGLECRREAEALVEVW
jgi:hypothetical protein